MHDLFHQRRYLIPFRAALLPQIFTDVLVIGGGVAGLRTAISAADHGDVIVVNKASSRQSNTNWAQGGIAAVLTEEDSCADHAEDTIDAGAGLCDPTVVQRVVEAAPERIEELIDWGMPF
ncbi:MAG: FAD-dependent oxidoreductase, partial [Phycisphaeraceae bacterium]|nr:FAD-dependent oxidoreductase [Phycisphaeraceae bacterium]